MKTWGKVCLLSLLFFCILFGSADAAGMEIVRVPLVEQKENVSFYPALANAPNAFAADRINRAIEEALDVAGLRALQKSGAPGSQDTVLTYECVLLEAGGQARVLSVVGERRGRLPGGRTGHMAIPLMFDLKTGQRILSQDLLSEDAGAFAEDYVNSLPEQEDRPFLAWDEALPFPLARGVLWHGGMRFFYPEHRFVSISGKTGAFFLRYDELKPYFVPQAVALELDSYQAAFLGETSLASMHKAMEDGLIPHLPKVEGTSRDELKAKYGLLNDAEQFLRFTRYDLDDDRFFRTSVVMDDGGKAKGVHLRWGNYFGLAIGKTTLKEAQALLKMDKALPMSEEAALQYATVPGQALHTEHGCTSLMLSFDTEGVLRMMYIEFLQGEQHGAK